MPLGEVHCTMPPPPPPGPPPPPAAPSGRGPKPFGKKAGGGAPDRNALLSSIQQGKALKKTVTNDRSAPLVGGTKTSNNTQGSSNLNGGPKFPPGGSKPSTNRSENGNGETPRLPGIGGLFAGGMPQLKPAGSRGINSGKTSGMANYTQLLAPFLFFLRQRMCFIDEY